ncbi:hypothetical protein AB0M61_23650 [Streptomyces sp. NPDC051642]|uniref:hypothetical protein n=1 Tax=Streptomyces sp. NPDC051642 TaxID=3154646 RepID=UPI003436D123
MTGIEVGVAALLITVLAGVGLGAITRGWTPLVRRDRIARPRLWGYGILVSDAGLAGLVYFGPYSTPHSHGPLAVTCTGVSIAGIVVQQAAARPGKPAKPTKNAS